MKSECFTMQRNGGGGILVELIECCCSLDCTADACAVCGCKACNDEYMRDIRGADSWEEGTAEPWNEFTDYDKRKLDELYAEFRAGLREDGGVWPEYTGPGK